MVVVTHVLISIDFIILSGGAENMTVYDGDRKLQIEVQMMIQMMPNWCPVAVTVY